MNQKPVLRCPWRLRLSGKRKCRFAGRSEFALPLTWRGHWLLLTWRACRGYHVAAWWKSRPATFAVLSAKVRWECPEMKKRSVKASAENVRHLAAVETTVFAGLLPLVEHCCIRQYDDGDPREPGWVQIRTTGAAWTVTVKDPDTCTSFQTVAETIDKALETAALLLSCDEAPWERDVWLEQSKARSSRKK